MGLTLASVLALLVPTYTRADCPQQEHDGEVLAAVTATLARDRLAGRAMLRDMAEEPMFPLTAGQHELLKDWARRSALGEKPDGAELSKADTTPRGVDLELREGYRVPRAMVDAAYERVGCPIPEVSVEGLSWIRTAWQYDSADSERFWREARERYGSVSLMAFSLPAYSPDRREAIVTYSRMYGDPAGMAELVFLRQLDDEWKVVWHVTSNVY